MKRVMVRYRVKADRAEENKKFIRNVFSELVDRQPEGLRYVSFVSEDGVSFVHIACIETKDGSNPLSETAAFKTFVSEIKERCDDPPVAVELDEVGSYRLFGN